MLTERKHFEFNISATGVSLTIRVVCRNARFEICILIAFMKELSHELSGPLGHVSSGQLDHVSSGPLDHSHLIS